MKTISVKLNDESVDNDQETLICYDGGGLLAKISDRLSQNRSYPGGVSNAEEVKNSEEYIKYEEEIKEIKRIFADGTMELNKKAKKKQENENVFVTCPWCNSKIPSNVRVCEYCNGKI